MSKHDPMKTSVARLRLSVTGVLLAALLSAPVAAQEQRGEREMEAARERIHNLQREAEELQESGRIDKAEALRHEAKQLEQRLHRHLEQRQQREGQGDIEKTIERLEQGMAALRELGRRDELERLEQIAAELRKRHSHQTEQRHRGDDERQMALRNIEIMRFALEALAEAERPDAADLVERALRTREMALEGRRDEEARRMRASAPDAEQLVELLGMANEILQDRGRGERAEAVRQLAGQLREHLRRNRPQRERRERHDRAERDRPDRPDMLQRFMERVERLEQRLSGIEQAMERLQEEIGTLKHDGD